MALKELAENLLFEIRKNDRKTFLEESLARQFAVEPENIARAVGLLVEWGYKLNLSSKNKKLRFISPPDILSDSEIKYNLKTKVIGQTVFAYNSVKSTNDIAATMAAAKTPAPHGTIITANEQTKGRGRLGRSWHSPPGNGIYLSIILRPKFSPEKAPGISIMTALALTETINKLLPGRVQIKWPNDIFINGKKTSGILTELSAEKNKINHLIVGVGINVNQPPGSFPDEIKDTATSIRKVLRKKTNRAKLLKSFLLNFEKEYELYCKSQLSVSLKRLRKYSYLQDKHVRIISGNETIDGRVIGLNEDGSIIIKQKDKTISVASGEVTIDISKK